MLLVFEEYSFVRNALALGLHAYMSPPFYFFYVKALATPAVHPAPSFLFSVELEAECAFDNNKIGFLFNQFIPFASLVASRDDHGEVFHVFYNDVIGVSAWISC